MRTMQVAALGSLVLTAGASVALASHVPMSLDVNQLWTPHADDGYLEFINPTEHPNLIGTPVPTSPPGAIITEEHTGYTLANGMGVYDVGDNDMWAGDRADFDWVQEHRPDETGSPPNSNHPGQVGAMGWTIGTPETSPHVDPGTMQPHNHSDEENPPGALPHLVNDVFAFPEFVGVDVFSAIVGQIDTEMTARDAALDYVVDFVNSQTGAFSPAMPIRVWIPGWTNATGADDYVCRWVPVNPGFYDFVAIEPASGDGHDDVTEIDAIKAFIPEPGAASILLFGAVCALRRRR